MMILSRLTRQARIVQSSILKDALLFNLAVNRRPTAVIAKTRRIILETMAPTAALGIDIVI
jgi:hypothetical protein